MLVIGNVTPPITTAHCRLDFGIHCFDNDSVSRVVIEHLTKNFQGPSGKAIRALDDVSLTVEDKELMVLVGPSGCGKTTLLRLISGLEEATEGEISIGGKSMKKVSPGERNIAMVFQNHALYPHMSAYENMAFGLKVRKCPKAEIEQRVKEAAQMLDLTDCLERKPKELSGGQRQRVALGRAIVRRPEVFLFDEPLSNLDAQMRVQMRTEIAKLHKVLGVTMIYVTHDQVEAMTMGDQITVMNRGVIQQVGEPMSVYECPTNLFVAGFIGSPQMNLFNVLVVHKDGGLFVEEQTNDNGEIAGSRFSERVEGGVAATLKEYVGKTVVLGIRPENVRAAAREAQLNGEIIEAVVELVEPIGAETLLYLGRGKKSVVARTAGRERAGVNDKLTLKFEMAGARFFDPVTGKAIAER
jgi:multiple sugar transport system ATP-binding protein